MAIASIPWVKRWNDWLGLEAPDLIHQTARIRLMERNIGIPVRVVVIAVLFYYLFFSNWFEAVTRPREVSIDTPPRELALETIRLFFLIYVVLNAGAASILIGMNQLPLVWVQRVVFTMSWLDGLFLSALTLVTGGFDSVLYWVFLGLIVRNAVSIPEATRQIAVNLMVSLCYMLAGILDVVITDWETKMMDEIVLQAIQDVPTDSGTESFVLRLFLLLLMTLCCYGVQVLLEKQRRAQEEAREYALRQEQLQATGRLAAEIAHQLKNPLGIINNAAFTLQRTVKEGKTITQQIQIIREEVERSDRILTELMGYARLSEGRVEKLNILEELDAAIYQVFPPAAKYDVDVRRHYAQALPPLLVQKAHLSEVFVNLLQNAREAMNGHGIVDVTAIYGPDYSVVVSIADNGPGIPPDKVTKIFEPYFTTKEKGTGLGLAIVKHNTELYNGTVQVESEIGKGAKFTVTLPAKTVFKVRK